MTSEPRSIQNYAALQQLVLELEELFLLATMNSIDYCTS